MKDTWDVMKIAKLWTYKAGCWLDELEMAYALYRLWFHVEYFTWYSKQDDLDYIRNPIEFVTKHTKEKYKPFIRDGKWIDADWQRAFDMTDTKPLENITNENAIGKHYQEDIIDAIEKNQGGNVLFILCVNRYILYNEPEIEWESWGHIVLCKWIKNNKFEIYDSGPFQKPEYIDVDRVLSSMTEMGPYVFIKIKDDRKIQ